MHKHDFYADPTVFDHWQAAAGQWLHTRGIGLRPYAWAITFMTLGAIMLSVSLALLGLTVGDTFGEAAPAWNRSLARGVAAVVALGAAQALFRQALYAWPRGSVLPGRVRRVAQWLGRRPLERPARGGAAGAVRRSSIRPPTTVSGSRDDVQRFFSAVRDAGVNVAIARALLAAGIRSTHQLQRASDAQLAAIRGVGPATVRRLRKRFGSPAQASSSPSSD